ncbi:MAG: hypothetical protein J6B87_00150 [Clostridia bacterium]|nr:hypothetical protein [Clostridia bacterium]
MKTIKFEAVVGIVAGYAGEAMLAEAAKIDPNAMGKAWQDAAQDVMEKTGVYVSATINTSKALYATAWGCPVGGEPTYTISGSLNPRFGEASAWKEAVLAVIRRVKEVFNQSTVTVEFWEVDQEYLE